jgi:putative FmdB family regulatory protein
MPTYEYYCEKCKNYFDIFQSMKADPLEICPEELCRMKTWGKGKVKRQLGTGAGLIFKGSGFYITDYRSQGYKEAAKRDSASATPSTSSPSSSEKGAGSKSSSDTKKSPPKEKG